jgi:hypothetical protein
LFLQHLMDGVTSTGQASGASQNTAFVEMENESSQVREQGVEIPGYLLGAFYRGASARPLDITKTLSSQGVMEFHARVGMHTKLQTESAQQSLLEVASATTPGVEIPSGFTGDVARFRAALDQGLGSVGEIPADEFLQSKSTRVDASAVADRIVARVENTFAAAGGPVSSAHMPAAGDSDWAPMSEESVDAVEKARQGARALSAALQKLQAFQKAPYDDLAQSSLDGINDSRHYPMRFRTHESETGTSNEVEASLESLHQTLHSSHDFRSSLLNILDDRAGNTVSGGDSGESIERAMDDILIPHQFPKGRARSPLRIVSRGDAKYNNVARYVPVSPAFSSTGTHTSFDSTQSNGQDSSLDEEFATFARVAVDQSLKVSDPAVLLEVVPSSVVQSALLDASLGPALEAAAAAADELRKVEERSRPPSVGSGSRAHAHAPEHRFVQRAGSALMEATDDLRSAEQERLSADVERRIHDIFQQATAEQARFAGQERDFDPAAVGSALGNAAGAAAADATAKAGQAVASMTEGAGKAGSAAIRMAIPAAATVATAAMKAGASAAEGLERGVNVAVEAVEATTKVAKQAYAKGQELYKEYAPIVADGAKKAAAAAGKAANKGALYASAGLDKAAGVLSKWDPSKAFAEKQYTSWGNAEAPIGQYPERGMCIA